MGGSCRVFRFSARLKVCGNAGNNVKRRAMHRLLRRLAIGGVSEDLQEF
jgi:hypothetical protein